MNTLCVRRTTQRGRCARHYAGAAALVLLCGSAWGQPAGVRVVNHLAAPGGNGQSWATAYADLQNALAEARANPGAVEQIWVAAGEYAPANDAGAIGVEHATFELVSSTGIYGGFQGGETMLEERDYEQNITTLNGAIGDNIRVFHVVTASGTDATAILDGFTIRGGAAYGISFPDDVGAGILNLGGTPIIRNCIITSNTSVGSQGGAGVHSTGAATFINCAFTANIAATRGGAVAGELNTFVDCIFDSNKATWEGGAIAGGGHFTNCEFTRNWSIAGAAVQGGGTFIDCLFEDNAADGGTVMYDGSFHLTDCIVRGNRDAHGGTIAYAADIIAEGTLFAENESNWSNFLSSSIQARNCRFIDNFGANGAGLLSATEQSSFVNCLFARNSTWMRAAIEVRDGGEVTLTNCTLIENEGAQGWGAILVSHEGAIATVNNSVLWNNGGASEGRQVTATAGQLAINHSAIQGWTGSLGGTGNFGFDPNFADSEGRLAAGSPCIDAGNNNLLPTGITTDLDGNPRFHKDPGTPNNGIGMPPIVDMGAFEFQGETCYANCTGRTTEPILSVDDFTCFIDRFAQSHPLANCDGSTTEPILTVDDFTCFINAFAAGCP